MASGLPRTSTQVLSLYRRGRIFSGEALSVRMRAPRIPGRHTRRATQVSRQGSQPRRRARAYRRDSCSGARCRLSAHRRRGRARRTERKRGISPGGSDENRRRNATDFARRKQRLSPISARRPSPAVSATKTAKIRAALSFLSATCTPSFLRQGSCPEIMAHQHPAASLRSSGTVVSCKWQVSSEFALLACSSMGRQHPKGS